MKESSVNIEEKPMNLPILDLKQNTPEWHQWRAQGLGASDIAALYGKHPYLTEYQLWLQKTGQAEAFKGNVATEHGQREEPHAFHALKTAHNLYDLETGCLQHPQYPHLRCSIDAYSLSGKIIMEIKSFFGEKNRSITKYEQIPEYCVYQMQYQEALFRCYDAEWRASLFKWLERNENNLFFPLQSDLALQADMIEKAHQWWQHHVVMGNPVKPDTILLSQQEVLNKLSLYEEYQSTAKMIDEQKKALKCEIETYLDGQSNYHTDAHQIIRVSPRSSYDFQKMKLDGIDLNKYKIQNEKQSSYIIKKRKS